MNIKSLTEHKVKLLEDCDRIKCQLSIAQSRIEKREPVDKDWINKAKSSLKYKQRAIEKTQNKISELKLSQKSANIKKSKNNQKTFERAFMSSVKSLLGEEQYKSLCDEVQESIDNYVHS